jgi:3-deoxy-D-manno-octulosonate 8-phosphate phosphatase (KDO 8-P phosphatase)
MTLSEMEDSVRLRLAQVRLLSLDVDGVLTDGGLYYTESGEELKKFNAKDGQGIKLLMAMGVEVAIITASRSQAAFHRAKTLGIEHVFIGAKDKLCVLQTLCREMGLSLDQVAHVGDDVNDIPILESVGCPLSVADAMAINKSKALWVASLPGGQGAVREICDLLCSLHSGKP